MVDDSWCRKPMDQTKYWSTYAIFYVTIVLSVFRSELLRKVHLNLPLNSTKSNEIKNDDSDDVNISCTTQTNFISKAKPRNKKKN